MASRKDRFGHLGDAAPGSGDTADLFEHYGIALDPAHEATAMQAVQAQPCRRCGWLLASSRDEAPCPLCAEAEPHAEPEQPAT